MWHSFQQSEWNDCQSNSFSKFYSLKGIPLKIWLCRIKAKVRGDLWSVQGKDICNTQGAPFTTRLLTQQKGQPLDLLSPPGMPAFCRCVSRTSLPYSLNHLADTNEHRSSALIIGPWQVNIIGISLTKHTPQRHVQLLRLWFSERRLSGC